MLLQWISLAFLVSPAAAATKHILDKIDATSQAQQRPYDEQKPFSDREVGQATVWEVKNGETFAFYLMPREDCQEVWVCSTEATVQAISSVNVAQVNNWCKHYVRFRPIEGSVTTGMEYGKTGKEKTYTYPWPRVVFKKHGNSYKLTVAKGERDIYGVVQDTEEVDLIFSGMPLIITSSPYCRPVVQTDSTGRPVPYVTISHADFKLAYPGQRDNEAAHTKKFNGLLVPTHIEKYTFSTTVKCPPIWLTEFEKTMDNWQTQTFAEKQTSTHMLYTIKRRDTCAEGENARSSIKLQIDNPHQCNWIRLCFFEDDKEICPDPTKSVELLLAYKLFVGIDSDQSRGLEVDGEQLRSMRFQMHEIDGRKRFTMSYSFASDEGAVQQHMYGESLKEWATAQEFKVSLSRDANCMARLVTDHLLETDSTVGKQCLAIKKCGVVKPEQYHPLDGSDLVNLQDFGPK